jgi:hypothetical protein
MTFTRPKMASGHQSKSGFVLLLGLLVACVPWCMPGVATAANAELPIPAIEAITRVDRVTRPSKAEMESMSFIVKTRPHPTLGDAYLIVTDHTEDLFLRPLERLAQHRAGTVLRVDDLGSLPSQQQAREQLAADLRKVRPRFVAIAPRLSSYRENVLLAVWEVLAKLDDDPQLDVFPGLLVAPNAPAFEALVNRSIRYQPQDRAAVRPFVIGQVGDASVMGQRSLQKIGVVRNLFDRCGCQASSLITRTLQATRSDAAPPAEKQQWEVSMQRPRQFITSLPSPAKQALGEASLWVMFGHGVPGMTCSLDVNVFHDVAMTNKVVLCGSCFSACPLKSDFPAIRQGPDGSGIQNDRERFLMRAVENGAVVVFGHMRLNSGFPHLYPVLEAWMAGLTVGEAYQRLINALIDVQDLTPGEFVLRDELSGKQSAVMRRNPLLYVIVGDPALQPLLPLN